MRKLVVGTFLTLDGVMQAPGGPEEDRSGGFEHGGWLVPLFDNILGRAMDEWIGRLGGLVLGRKTYEIFAAHWPHAGKDDPVAAAFNRVPKYIASRTLDRVDWQPGHLLRGDIVEAIRRLKAEPGGELQVHGSASLIQTLVQNRLVDEFRIWIAPVLLGKGKRLFAEGAVPTGLELVETRTTSTGVVLHVHRVVGDVTHGSFALDEPTAAEIARRERVGIDG